jgi:MFS family permease
MNHRGEGYEARAPSAWRPLRHTLFRWLWIATFVSNIGNWMQDVGGAWLMTTMDPSPVMVTLVQVATCLPMVILALPAGTFADVVDRRRLLLVMQSWLCITAAGFGVAVWLDIMTPWLLLSLTGVMSIGLAFNSPARRAITAELVSREDLAGAISLKNASVNVARALGPALGGFLMATLGPAVLFFLNAISFLGVIGALYTWRRPKRQTRLPAEHFWGALQAGLRYVWYAPAMWSVMARAGTFTLCGSALWAMLPLVVHTELRQDATGYGLVLGCFGLGAAMSTLLLPRLQPHWPREYLVAVTTIVFALALALIGMIRVFGLFCLVMVMGGSAWLILLTSFSASAQEALPAWVRGRALAAYILIFFGGMAGGSLLWGTVAERIGIAATLWIAAGGVLLALAATHRCPLITSSAYDTSPSRHWPMPDIDEEPEYEQGPVLITLEYRIDPAQCEAFVQAVRQLGRIRRRDGALRWGVFGDAAETGRYIESFIVETWGEYLRQRDRFTVADREIEERVFAYHQDQSSPCTTHFIAERC